jgi:hypothetical protein
MANRRVLSLPRTCLDRAHHDLAGVDPDAPLDSRAAVGDHFCRIPLQFLPDAQRGIQRPLRMVLVRDRRAEQGEDAVAGRLNDVAVVAMRCVDHQLQCRVDNRARLLRVEVLHQLGRAFDVREQRRHRLALAVDHRRSIRLPRRDADMGSRR